MYWRGLKKSRALMVLLCIFAAAHFAAAQTDLEGKLPMDDYILIDDFTSNSSTLDTSWDGFTDQVMGGVSEMSVSRMTDADERFVRMSGVVSTKNNGGFIQIRLKLTGGSAAYDGSSYKGLRLKARGIGDSYFIFLRTTGTVLPWKFFKGAIPVSEEWQIVDIPWSAFDSGDYGRSKTLKINRLKSLALVAYGKSFDAQLDVSEIGFYK